MTFTFSKIKLTTMKYYCFSLNFLLYISVKKHQLVVNISAACWRLDTLFGSLFKFHPVLLFNGIFFLSLQESFCDVCFEPSSALTDIL